MTFDEYIKNPMGTANAVMSNRNMYNMMYTDKLNKILVRENGKIDYKLYVAGGGKYYAHLKIPSETVKEFYYDIVIEFTVPKKELALLTRPLKYAEVRFFSNDPAFTYTFAHAFNKNKLFITELSDLMMKEALKKNADMRNPNNDIGYVKTLYFAYLYMEQKNLFQKTRYTEKFNLNVLKASITPTAKKISERQAGTKEIQRRKKESLDTLRDIHNGDDEGSGSITKRTKQAIKVNRVKNSVSVGKVVTGQHNPNVGMVTNNGGIKKTKTIGKRKR